MPEWISVWVAKILGSEPVVKVMYVLLVWAIVVIFAPESIAASISDKSKIPFMGQICLMAFSFVVVDAVHRGIRRWDSYQADLNVEKEKESTEKEEKNQLLKEFNLLDDNEKERLSRFFSLGKNVIWFSTRDVSAMSLSTKRFIDCMHDSRRIDGDLYMTYRINDKYAAFLKELFKTKGQ
ncbi:TPA: superinfection exclusion B family protein [Salmonella enterica]|nr:superinfection exclusion B family protein [Salmonella enterica]